jgi:hypothetical protein
MAASLIPCAWKATLVGRHDTSDLPVTNTRAACSCFCMAAAAHAAFRGPVSPSAQIACRQPSTAENRFGAAAAEACRSWPMRRRRFSSASLRALENRRGPLALCTVY